MLRWTIGVLLVAVTQVAGADTHALLVGVSSYPNLPERYRLLGPGNDVKLVRLALQRIGTPNAQISVLADGVDGSSALPTRANILEAIAALARHAKRGDWIVVLLAGHGSQQPQAVARRAAAGAYIEPDGMDEVFLPYDVAEWRGDLGSMTNVLLDDEIGVALAQLIKAGLNVWVVFDTCHAGDMAKGTRYSTSERTVRYVPPRVLGVPAAASRGPSDAARSRTDSIRSLSSSSSKSSGNLVIFSASQADEPAAEELLPVPDWARMTSEVGDMRRYGLFSYQIAIALPTWNGAFSSLVQTLSRAYKPRPFPTPLFEGTLEEVMPLQQHTLTTPMPNRLQGVRQEAQPQRRP